MWEMYSSACSLARSLFLSLWISCGSDVDRSGVWTSGVTLLCGMCLLRTSTRGGIGRHLCHILYTPTDLSLVGVLWNPRIPTMISMVAVGPLTKSRQDVLHGDRTATLTPKKYHRALAVSRRYSILNWLYSVEGPWREVQVQISYHITMHIMSKIIDIIIATFAYSERYGTYVLYVHVCTRLSCQTRRPNLSHPDQASSRLR